MAGATGAAAVTPRTHATNSHNVLFIDALFFGYVPPAPVLAELLEKRQRLERRHAIEKQHAVEVIGLVLDDARRETARVDLDPASAAVVRLHLDLPRARDAAADVGNAEAAFPLVGGLVPDDVDFGVDERHQRNAVLFRVLVVFLVVPIIDIRRDAGDEEPHAFVHLRRRQPDTLVLLHR